jgi:hypothetical protein
VAFPIAFGADEALLGLADCDAGLQNGQLGILKERGEAIDEAYEALRRRRNPVTVRPY